jgi:hypothetical protein
MQTEVDKIDEGRDLSNLHRSLKHMSEVKTSRVPDTFQLGAISPFSAFRAARKIDKLRVFRTPEYSDSPRLPHIFVLGATPLFASSRSIESLN